jgi:hypothetical protein
MRLDRRWIPILAAAGVALTMALSPPATASNAKSIALLGTHFQNDNEIYEPTSAAERARLKRVGEAFTEQLANSGQFVVKPVPQAMAAKIEAGQPLGECGGCELDFGASLGVDEIAWINVQKVSNLILNLNVYIADVKTKKMTFVRSVDIRGNTDESWLRSLTYLVKNYLLPSQG